jgi:hypothetical protein
LNFQDLQTGKRGKEHEGMPLEEEESEYTWAVRVAFCKVAPPREKQENSELTSKDVNFMGHG